MTTRPPRAERRLTAFLANEDSPDIRNPMHSTAGALQYGFRGALVGGGTVYGWAVPAILEVLGDGWLEHGWVEVAFRRPVYPGQEVVILVEAQAGAGHTLQVSSEDGVCISGTLGLGDAPWLPELHVPVRRGLELRHPEPVALTLATAPVGEQVGPLVMPATLEEMRQRAREIERNDDPRFTGPAPLVPPSWVLGATTRLLFDQFQIRHGIDVTRRVQHLARLPAGMDYTIDGYLAGAYERKGHHYLVIDASLTTSDGAEVARLRQSMIFRVAPPASEPAAHNILLQ